MKRVLLATLLAASSAFAAPKHATILFAGDDGGEVAPCG